MHSGAALESGECFTWGGNELGQLGLPGVETFTSTPQRIVDLEEGVASIACGYYQTLILTYDGTLLACGLNEAGQLGVEEDSEIVDLPIPVKGISEPINGIYCTNFNCLTSEDGSMYIWGDTPNGLFTKPERINGLAEIISQVAIGEDLICVLDVNNYVYTWGRNEVGQLGLGDTETQKDACSVEILNDREMVSICAGKNFVICLGKGATAKAHNPLLDKEGSEDGQDGLKNRMVYGELAGVQRGTKGNQKGVADRRKRQTESENEQTEFRTEDDGIDYQLIGVETFGEKYQTHDSEDVNIKPPSSNRKTKSSGKQQQPENDQNSEEVTNQESERDLDVPVPDNYQLPKSILDLYRNQKQTEAIYSIKEVESMQNENIVLKQLVCTYEKIRQDLVSVLDAIVKNDPSLIEQLDPRDIQK
jgi:hypothetical protein